MRQVSFCQVLLITSCLGACGVRELSVDASQSSARKALTSASGTVNYHAVPNKCMDVRAADTSNGAVIQLYDCNGTGAQSWTYVDGTLRVLGNKCLDLPGGDTTNGTLLQTWDCQPGNLNQQWTVLGQQIKWQGHDKCIDLPWGTTTNATRLQIWDCGAGNPYQTWDAGFEASTTPTTPTAPTTPTTPTAPAPAAGSGRYTQLVWSDEFSGTALDGASWSYEVNCLGGYNNEMECYTQDMQNISFDGQGHMVVTAVKAPGTLDAGRTWTSARINTQNKRDFTYGRMEASIQIPSGQGIWPAFWMMPTASVYGGWPTSGELDIMEILGNAPGTLYGTAHYGVPSPYTQSQGIHNGADLSQGFHVFALERDATQIRWYLDDTLYYTLNASDTNFWPNVAAPADKKPWPFSQPFFFIINLAIGGSWPGAPDASLSRATMLVDYVRVFQ